MFASRRYRLVLEPKLLLPVFASALAVFFISFAWVAEDAFITFRSVEQLYAGNGPRWNPHERVQAFTHPLWFIMLAGLRLVSSNLYALSIGLGFACSMAVAILFLRKAGSVGTIVGVGALLVSSKSFTDYATSGLENPLVQLCVLLAALRLFQGAYSPGVSWASLAVLTRIDSGLSLLPLLGLVSWEEAKNRGWKRTVNGALPGALLLGAWHVFSLWYYGFLLPNTAYAKLGAGIPLSTRLEKGLSYLGNSLSWDPITLLVILSGIALGVFASHARLRALAVGLGLQTLYVIWIGGDFMSGRFLTLPFCIGLLILLEKRSRILLLGPVILALSLVLSPRHMRTAAPTLKDRAGVADERLVYFRSTGLIPCVQRMARGAACIDHRLAEQGRKFRESSAPIKVWPNIGLFGYFAGTEKIIIDELALTDPLLARLPTRKRRPRIGHYPRAIPEGYLESILNGRNEISDPGIRACYAALQPATSGSLTSLTRIKILLGLQGLHCRPEAVHGRKVKRKSKKTRARQV